MTGWRWGVRGFVEIFRFEGCGAVVCGVKGGIGAYGEREVGREQSGGSWRGVRRFRVDWLGEAVRAGASLPYPALPAPPGRKGAELVTSHRLRVFGAWVAVRFFWPRLRTTAVLTASDGRVRRQRAGCAARRRWRDRSVCGRRAWPHLAEVRGARHSSLRLRARFRAVSADAPAPALRCATREVTTTGSAPSGA